MAPRKIPDLLQVLAIYGENDSPGFLDDLPQLEAMFPNYQAVIVPGGGHAAYLDDPELFNSKLIELARNISDSAPGPAPAGAPQHVSFVLRYQGVLCCRREGVPWLCRRSDGGSSARGRHAAWLGYDWSWRRSGERRAGARHGAART